MKTVTHNKHTTITFSLFFLITPLELTIFIFPSFLNAASLSVEDEPYSCSFPTSLDLLILSLFELFYLFYQLVSQGDFCT